jgi:hypothetical protein
MKQIKYCIIIFGLMGTTATMAGESLGFGLSKKYCLGDVCLGETDADHPELKIGEALKKAARYKKIPICNRSDASVYLREVKFRNGTQGIIYLLADPGNLNAKPEKYFRISSITVKFDPFLSAEGVKDIQQKIVSRYGMERTSSYSFGIKDGKRSIGFTVSPWESRIAVNGIDNSEFLAQPGCSPKPPNL